MIARLKTSSISGLEARSVDVEVQSKLGQNKFTIIGLGDSAVKEARDRVTAALRQSGFRMPNVVLVNLAPAEIKKEGSSFDLAIALGILVSTGQLPSKDFSDTYIYGELSLDGRIKPVRGVVALVICALQTGFKKVIVPAGNFREASLVSGLEIVPIDSLTGLISYFKTGRMAEVPESIPLCEEALPTFDDVWGQERAKRAMIIAAAGGHNLLMIGPPGCGKSMLASRFTSILPPMFDEECLEVVKIHSLAGLPIQKYLNGSRPYRNPHHVVSDVGLIGGGSNPRPGEISLAHHGVLFLDEFPEYRRSAIEALRAPLENGKVQITRAKASYTFPSRFQLIAAMNPCPCGRLGLKNVQCLCSRPAIHAYLQKLSEPILDRIDLHVELDAVPLSQIGIKPNVGCKHELVLNKISAARTLQIKRRSLLNAHSEAIAIGADGSVNSKARRLLEMLGNSSRISARTFVRLMRVARTIADIDQVEVVSDEHVAEALSYRQLENLRKYSN